MDLASAPTILVVDDNRDHTQALAKVFARAGYCVQTACDGQEALALLMERPFNLVITDLRMPRMNGLDLRPSIAVTILTAFGEWTTYMDAMNCGCVDYVNKLVRRDIRAPETLPVTSDQSRG